MADEQWPAPEGVDYNQDHNWSVRTDVLHRSICPTCQHFHREAIIRQCACCRADVQFKPKKVAL